MNYLLVKREDLGDKFQFAETLPEPDGRVILPCNYIKVLAGVSVQVIGYQELIDLKESLKTSVASEEEQVAAGDGEGSENSEQTDEAPVAEETHEESEEKEVAEQPNDNEEGENNDNQPETAE